MKTNIKEMLHVDQVLSELGLARQRSNTEMVLTALGIFVGGAVVGGFVAMLVAPSTGRDLRGAINRKVRGGIPGERAGNNLDNHASTTTV